MKEEDILYRPNLGYEKSYYTEGEITDNKDIDNKKNDSEIKIEQDPAVKGLIDTINKKIAFLDKDMKEAYISPYFGMLDEYNRLIDEKNKEPEDPIIPPDKKPEDKKPEPPVIEDPDDDNDDDPIKLFDMEDDIYIDIVDPLADPVKFLHSKYYIDFIDIYVDYLNKLDITLENYIYTTLRAVSMNTLKGKLFDYKTINIKNKDLMHVSDYLTKSKIMLEQNMRMHKKLFEIDETILHVRSIRISNEQMLRYNGINELVQKSFLDVDANVILKESIIVAEKKYEENLYSLYKYLNSSVILLDESIKTVAKQNKAMIIINNNEVRE